MVTRVSHVIVLSTTSKKLNKMKTTKRTIMHCSCLNDRILKFYKSRLYAVWGHVIYNDFSQLTPEVVFSFQGVGSTSRTLRIYMPLSQDPPFFANFVLIIIFREGANLCGDEIIIYIV